MRTITIDSKDFISEGDVNDLLDTSRAWAGDHYPEEPAGDLDLSLGERMAAEEGFLAGFRYGVRLAAIRIVETIDEKSA
jgi:hypothetical protein